MPHEMQKDHIYHPEIGLGGEKVYVIDYYPNFCPENHMGMDRGASAVTAEPQT